MTDKLFIPKTILNHIAYAIRDKTGSYSPIKVKDMPDEIKNISTGIPFETVLTGRFESHDRGQKITTKLISRYVNGSVTAEGAIRDMPITFKIYEKGKDVVEWKTTTSVSGENTKEWTTENIESIDVELPNPAPFQRKTLHFDNNILYLTGTNRNVRIRPVDSYQLVVVDEEKGIIEHSYGSIDYTADSDNWKIQYRGVFNKLYGSQFDWENIVSADVPITVTSMPDDSPFKQHETLENIRFRGINELPAEAFWYCELLEIVRINHDCHKIGHDAFNRCYNLKHINIPALTEIEGGLIYFDDGLEHTLNSLILDSGLNINVDTQFGNMEKVHNLVLAGRTINEEENLSYNSYWYSEQADNVYFNDDTVTLLENSANNLQRVKTVTIPCSCKYIENNVFLDIDMLHGAFIFEGIIPPKFDFDATFPSYWSNYTVYVPPQSLEKYIDVFYEHGIHDVKELPYGNLYGPYKITFIGKQLTSTSNTPFDLIEEGFDDNIFWLDEVQQEETYDGGKIDYSFDDYGLHTFKSSCGFTRVNNSAFKNNEEITGFLFPHKLEFIDNEAFMNCRNLESLVFYDEPVDGIADSAFVNLHPDCKVYVPENRVGYFEDHPTLKNYEIITFPDREWEPEEFETEYKTPSDVDVEDHWYNNYKEITK